MVSELKKHFWLYTLSDGEQFKEIVYRTEHTRTMQLDLSTVKSYAANELGVFVNDLAIINRTYLGEMTEGEFDGSQG